MTDSVSQYENMIKMGVHKDILIHPSRFLFCSLCRDQLTDSNRLLLNCGHFICQQCFEEQKICAYPKCTIKDPIKIDFSMANNKSIIQPNDKSIIKTNDKSIIQTNDKSIIQPNDQVKFHIFCQAKHYSTYKEIKASCKISQLFDYPQKKYFLNYYGQDTIILIFGTKSIQYKKIKNQRIVDLQTTLRLKNTFLNKITVYQRRMGGGRYQFTFNSLTSKSKIQFSKAPKYRIISPGLNLEAQCSNDKCQAYNKKVWIKKGFGNFNMAKQINISVCPLCKIQTKPATNIGYYKTSIKIFGKQKGQKNFNFNKLYYNKNQLPLLIKMIK